MRGWQLAAAGGTQIYAVVGCIRYVVSIRGAALFASLGIVTWIDALISDVPFSILEYLFICGQIWGGHHGTECQVSRIVV